MRRLVGGLGRLVQGEALRPGAARGRYGGEAPEREARQDGGRRRGPEQAREERRLWLDRALAPSRPEEQRLGGKHYQSYRASDGEDGDKGAGGGVHLEVFG